MGQARHKTNADRIAGDANDWNGRCCALRGKCDRCARSDQDIDVEREKLGDQLRDPLRFSLRVAFLEHQVASDNVSLVGQTLTQSRDTPVGAAGTDPDVADIACCCARAASGRPAAVPPRSMMKSRRLIASPVAQGKTSYQVKLARWKGTPDPPDVRKGAKSDIDRPPTEASPTRRLISRSVCQEPTFG